MPHNLAGQIILEDMFSAPLSSLARLSQQAEAALRQMGGTVDTAAGTAANKIQNLEASLDALKQKAQSGGTMSVLDVNQFRTMSAELTRLQKTMEAATTVKVDVAQVTSARERVRELEQQIDALRAKGQTGAGLSVADVGQFRTMSAELERLKKSLEAATTVKVDTAQVTSARQRLKELEQQLDVLRKKALSGAGLSVADVSQFRKLTGEAKNLKAGLDEAAGASENLVQRLAEAAGINLGPLAGGLTAAAAAFAAMKVAQEAVELYKLGAQAARMETSFRTMATSVGASADGMLTALRRASHGTISDMELMLAANRTMMLGVTTDATTMARLLEVAIARGQAVGRSPLEAFNDIALGIGRVSGPILDNLGIMTGGERAFAVYAESIGKTAAELTDVEKRQFLVNKVLADTTPLVEDAQMRVERLGTAWGTLREAMGKSLVASFEMPDVSRFMSNAAEVINATTRIDEALKALDARASVPLPFSPGLDGASGLTAYAQYRSAVESLPAGTKDLIREKMRLDEQFSQTGDLEVYSRGIQNLEVLIGILQRQMAGGLDVGAQAGAADLSAFSELEAQAATQALRLAAGVDQVAQAIQVLEPSLAGSQLQTRLTAIGTAVETAVAQVRSALMGAAGGLGGEQAAALFDQQEQAVRRYAAGLEQAGISGNTAAFLLAAFTQKLIEGNREMRDGKAVADDLALALAGIGNAARGAAKASALNLVGVLGDAGALKAFRDRAAAIENYVRLAHTMGKSNEQIEFGLRQLEDSWRAYDGGIQKAATADERKIASTRALGNALTGLDSKIRTALSFGLEVTPGDMFATNAGAYQDSALESARRLNAIAERGFSELGIHPDWAGLLKIPPEVLSGSEEQLRAWASSTSASVQDLSRPDLINWDAFIANFQSQLDKEQAQKLTLDIAVNKLDEAGLLAGLGGDEQGRRDKVAEALGLKAPKITMEALLEADKNAGANFLSEVYPPSGVAMVPATLTPASATLTPVPLTAPGTTMAGGALAGSLYAGFTETLAGQDVGMAVVTAWSTSLTAKKSLEGFGTIGTTLGTTVAGAFVLAMKDGVGNVRRDIASIIAPEVAKILASQQPRTNLP